jgi:hypothetical protein
VLLFKIRSPKISPRIKNNFFTEVLVEAHRHPYSKEAGYQILAGQDVTNKQYRTTRYMLLYNPALTGEKRAVILTAAGKEPTKWELYAEGKSVDLIQMFDSIDLKVQ